MSRYFINVEDIEASTIIIKGEDVNHIKRVLRLQKGDRLVLCDSKGIDYDVIISEIGNESIKTSIVGSAPCKNEPNVDITLLQGIPKSDKMEYIIQKSTELGINRIIPVITQRSVVKINNSKEAENKRQRWQKIAIEASKQCNRGIIPIVEAPIRFNDALEIAKSTQLAIIPYEKEKDKKLREYMTNGIRSVSVIIGPEGGFTEQEINTAISSSIKPITLGPRILRTETAGIAVLSILMYELGDM